MKKYYVYKHIAPNGKIYIGQTCKKPNDRWRNGNGYKNQVFYRAIKKYGWDNFKHEILFEKLTKEEADQKEIELISYYDSANPEKGYNVALGGFSTLGTKCSEETKQKISNAHKGKKRSKESILKQSETLKGHIHSEETKKKIGEANSRRIWSDESKEKLRNANIGRVFSKEHKEKISEGLKGRIPSEKNRAITAQKNKERIWTDEARKKISDANRGRPAPNKKRVVCVESDVIYDSATEAANSLNISRSLISRVCEKKGKTAGSFHWMFYEDYLLINKEAM